MNRKENAINNFRIGYNCSQAVVLAFSDIFNIDKDTLLKMVSAFGGGYSRMRETCGAVSAIAFVIGYLKGYSDPDDYEKKKELYIITQNLIKEFKEKNKYLTCRELLQLDHESDSPIPSIRNEEFYKNRPCVKFIGDAAEILEDYFGFN